mgnify:CR=1 FL=1
MFSFARFLARQADHSEKVFGPKSRWKSVLDHIRKELAEIERKPDDLEEWIDVMLLAFDGARRATGAEPEDIVAALLAKQTKNEGRVWPDWRTVPDGVAIEHVRGEQD